MTASIATIQHTVAAHYGVTVDAILSPARPNRIVLARHLGMWLARRVTSCSSVAIGRKFGGRDHATVLHAVRHVEDLIERDPEFAAVASGLLQQVSA
jgi:chromosomal replication initiator protein